MAVRLLHPENDSAALAEAGGSMEKFSQRVRRWLGKGYTRPECCFVYEAVGKIAAGVCFTEFEEDALEIMDFAVGEDALPIAAQVLTECVHAAKKPRHGTVSYNLYNDSPQYSALLRVFADAGFAVSQLKKCFTFGGGVIPEGEGRLDYRAFSQVGEAAFVEAVMRVTAGTLDTDMARDSAKRGGLPAAQSYVTGLKNIDFNDNWWRLAYLGEALAGLIIPQQLGETVGAVNYIGVVPELRGRGLIHELLGDCTRILTGAGLTTIYADIDAANVPLEAALLRGGYQFKCEESVLVREM